MLLSLPRDLSTLLVTFAVRPLQHNGSLRLMDAAYERLVTIESVM